jgi:hypothetical protein
VDSKNIADGAIAFSGRPPDERCSPRAPLIESYVMIFHPALIAGLIASMADDVI